MNIETIIEELRTRLADSAKQGNLTINQFQERPEITIDVDGYFTGPELREIAEVAERHCLGMQPGIIRDSRGNVIECEYRIFLYADYPEGREFPASIRKMPEGSRHVEFKKYIPVHYHEEDGVTKQVKGSGCFSDDYIERGWFLHWGVAYEGGTAGSGNYTVALVEKVDGAVEEVLPKHMRFI